MKKRRGQREPTYHGDTDELDDVGMAHALEYVHLALQVQQTIWVLFHNPARGV
jgi:hypothetical protein